MFSRPLGFLFATTTGLLVSAGWLSNGYQAVAQKSPVKKSSVQTGELPIKTLPGFKTELVYSVPKKQGSWVSLASELPGCLVASDQYGKLYRIDARKNPVSITPLQAPIGRAQGLLFAFDSLYVMAHPGGGKPGGIYRLSQRNEDGQYKKVEFLRKLEGGGEHGPHAIVMSPDKKSLYICAGNHTNLPKVQKSRVPQTWKEDQVLPRMWDAGGHAVGKLAPGGWIAKMSPDGKNLECVAVGFRNQYDIAFDEEGELFTYDADMEWDVGTPWYRPTRVNHVVSGAEFGWRSGTGKWPDFYPDSLGSVVDIGPGSPTGITFGTHSKFPPSYKKALFIADWSYGVIYAVHLSKTGSTFSGVTQRFCSAPALQVADMAVLPEDGSLYFVVGGRRTKSGLYRIRLEDEKLVPSIPNGTEQLAEDVFEIRKKLEKLHSADSKEWQIAKEYLDHSDRTVRYAARLVLEHHHAEGIEKLAADLSSAEATMQWSIAMIRSKNAESKTQVLKKLLDIDWKGLSVDQKLTWLRAIGLAKSRWGEFSTVHRNSLETVLKENFPSKNRLLNQELSRLLIAFEFPWATQKCAKLLETADSQQEQMHYAYCLCWAKKGWTNTSRRSYIQWFLKAAALQGGNSFGGFVGKIRSQAIASMDIDSLAEPEKSELKKLLAKRPKIVDPASLLAKRKFVKKWTLEDVLALDKNQKANFDYQNGQKMFRIGLCFNCHRKSGQGGMVGPDLTAAGRRMNRHDLIQSLVEPNAVISDQYEATMFLMEDGRLIVGRVANLHGNRYQVQTDMLKPSRFTNVIADEVEEMQPSKTSMMPGGLLDTMTEKDIRDLLGYLRQENHSKKGK